MPINKLRRLREWIYLRMYGHRNQLLTILKGLSIIISIVALGSIVYYYGFPKTVDSLRVSLFTLKICLSFYILKYLIKLIYDFNPRAFLKSNWFEGCVLVFLFVNGLLIEIIGYSTIERLIVYIGITSFDIFYLTFFQLIFLLVVAIELGKASLGLSSLKIGPAALMTLSFILLIFSGAGLLILPEMTIGQGIRFIDALFTSTSACCVTGLVVVDTATIFTLKGKIIIMILIQLGGINIISFATFFATFYNRMSGLKYVSLLKDILSADRMSDTKVILREIILFSLIIEFIGALIMFFLWSDKIPFTNTGEKMFYSVFHSISAFNNAGFALFTNNLYEGVVRYSFGVHIVIAVLIFLGGLGFVVLQDIFGPTSIRDRLKYPWRHLSVGSKIALHTSLILIVVGTIGIYFLERNNSLLELKTGEAVIASFFQSITCRTAGFNTINFAILCQPVLIIMMVLMFIGASPGSTGGGIKTTTFRMLIESTIATIRGKENIEVFKHTIPFNLIDKSYSIMFFSISLILISSFLLAITEPGIPFLNLVFEEISAFGTVGLSTGITPILSDWGRIIIIISMFIGRIGTITLALALSKKVFTTKYRYTPVNIMIG